MGRGVLEVWGLDGGIGAVVGGLGYNDGGYSYEQSRFAISDPVLELG